MNVVVAQSGGPTGVINASVLGVYRQALQEESVGTVYGSLNGIEGVLQDNLVDLSAYLTDEDAMALLRQTPAAALGSCRYKLPPYDKEPAVYEQIRNRLEARQVGAFIYIGGNDSMDTVDKLAAYFATVNCPIRVMGVPKTIDNDLALTDHTPGYGSAAKFVATSMLEMIRDATVYDLDSVLIVEIMGRDTGWLTAAAALPHLVGETAPHLVYLPEIPLTAEKFIDDIRRVQKESRTVIVAVSEGVNIQGAEAFQSGNVDVFGHKYFSGTGKCLESLVRERLGCKVRSVELNILQRCSSHIASATDVEEAERAGVTAMQAAVAGHSGEMVAFFRAAGEPYAIEYRCVPVSKVANAVKYVPEEWITPDGNGVTREALAYILPLVQGEVTPRTACGMPMHFRFDR